MKKSTIITIAVLSLLTVGIAVSQKTTFFGAKPAISETPNPTIQTFSGESITISQYKGKIIVLNFWATWCPPCVAEIPALIELQAKYPNDVKVIGISVDQDTSKLKPFITQKGINYPIGYANSKLLSAFGGIQSIPTTYIIDRNFKIVESAVGFHSFKEFESKIKPYL